MPLTLSDFLNFPFNDGKGVRTNQLDGAFVKEIRADGTIVFQQADGTEVTRTPSQTDPHPDALTSIAQDFNSFIAEPTKDARIYSKPNYTETIPDRDALDGDYAFALGVLSQVLGERGVDVASVRIYIRGANLSTTEVHREDWTLIQDERIIDFNISAAEESGASGRVQRDSEGRNSYHFIATFYNSSGQVLHTIEEPAVLWLEDQTIDRATQASGEIADNSIAYAKILAGNAAQRLGWRGKIHASNITLGTAPPALSETRVGDIHLITQAVGDGLSFVDINDTNTVLMAAATGDVLISMVLREALWVRGGNLLTGSLAAQENSARLDVVEEKTSDVDLAVDSSVWGVAPAADVQITVIPTSSPLHAQILDRSFDPVNLPGAQAWTSQVTTSAINDIVLMRLKNGLDNLRYRYRVEGEPEPVFEHSQLPNADDTWTYFNLAQFAAGLTVTLQKRRDKTHGIWKGELGGTALALITDLEAHVTDVESRTDDIDVVQDPPTWPRAPSANAQFGLVANDSALGRKLDGEDSTPINPATDLTDVVWRSTVNSVPADNVVIARIQPDLEPIGFRMFMGGRGYIIRSARQTASDANWIYYSIGSALSGPITIQKKTDAHHTEFHGQLAGRAETQVQEITETAIEPALKRTAVFRPLTVWERSTEGRTILFEYKPIQAVHTNINATVTIGGSPINNVNPSEGLVELDDVGTVLAVPITDSQAANISSSSDARAGYVRCQIEADGADTITSWMRTKPSGAWRELTGSSPYTVLATDQEFLVEFGLDAANYNAFAIRPQITTTGKLIIVDSERPDGRHEAEAGVTFTLNSAGDSLTVAIHQEDADTAFTIKGVYAR